jgi:hypothetical protein
MIRLTFFGRSGFIGFRNIPAYLDVFFILKTKYPKNRKNYDIIKPEVWNER